MWILTQACLVIDKKTNTSKFVPVWEMQSDNEENCGLVYEGKQYYSNTHLVDVLYNTSSKEFNAGIKINYIPKCDRLQVGQTVYYEKTFSNAKELSKTKIISSDTRISTSYILLYTGKCDDYLFENNRYHITEYETVYKLKNCGNTLFKHFQLFTLGV